MLGPRRVARRGHRPVTGRFVVAGLCLLTFFLFLMVLIRTPIFSITHIDVIGDSQGKVTPQLLPLIQNQNIFLIDQSRVRADVLKNPLVKDLKFAKTLPNSMTVTVTFRDPAYSWRGKNGTFLVDNSGVVFQSGAGVGIPAVIAQDLLQLGQKLPSEVVNKVAAIVRGTTPLFVTVTIQPGIYLVSITGGTVANFDPTGDLDSQSQALQLIIAKAKIDGKLPRTVDLRFPKPVVTY